MVLVTQINLNKCKAASVEINRRVESDVVLITEPNSHRNRVVGLEPRADVFAARECNPRACIRSSTFRTWPVDSFMARDVATVAVEISGSGVVYFASVYLDIGRSVNLKPLWKLVDWCQSGGHALVIGMDSNAHSPLWGSSDLNSRGEELEELIVLKNLFVLNRGFTPTYVRYNSESVIDVSLVNQVAMRVLNVSGWEVEFRYSFSDHRYIKFEIEGDLKGRSMYRNVRKADWDLFQSTLGKLVPPPPREDGGDLEACAEALDNAMRVALNVACPEKPALSRKPNSWWTADLDRLRKETRELAKRRFNGPGQREAYVAKRKEYYRAIYAAKELSWRSFCSKAEGAKDVARLVKNLDASASKNVSLLSRDGELLPPEETLEHLLEAHFPEGSLDNAHLSPIQPEVADFSGFGQFINPATVGIAIKSFGDLKAPGPDGFSPIVLKKLPLPVCEYLTELYRVSVATGVTPRIWREMKVVFIPKAGKPSYDSPKSYRPITLSNFVLKALERVVQWYINMYHVKGPLDLQHAYTRGLSTETALSTFVDKVESMLLRGRCTLAVSLDCSGAFDSISFDSAESAMRRAGIPQNIIRWYDNILRGRRVSADLQGETATVRPGRGSPQGGILSPLIWNLIMDSLLSSLKGRAVSAVGYADDVMLFIQGFDVSVMEDRMQQALDRVFTWGRERGLCFNPAKTTVTLFTRRRLRTPVCLLLGGEPLTPGDSMTYLGLNFTKTLNWSDHVLDRQEVSPRPFKRP